jgi:hypothetical protein
MPPHRSRERITKPMDLHPLVDPVAASIEFRFVRKGRFKRVHLLKETLAECYGVADTNYGLLLTCEKHRPQIDAAVLRRADESQSEGVLLLTPTDLRDA